MLRDRSAPTKSGNIIIPLSMVVIMLISYVTYFMSKDIWNSHVT
jgi:hypothetical protein